MSFQAKEVICVLISEVGVRFVNLISPLSTSTKQIDEGCAEGPIISAVDLVDYLEEDIFLREINKALIVVLLTVKLPSINFYFQCGWKDRDYAALYQQCVRNYSLRPFEYN